MGKGYPGGRNIVRKALELKKLPVGSIEIAMSSITDSSYKQYECCFKKYWKFCSDQKLNPFSCTVPDIIEFLTAIFNTGLSYSSLNSYRSAISLIVGPEVAEDFRMKRFFKGVSKQRPAKPKYDSTWDPKIVLDLLSSWGDNENLTLKDLSRKVVTLLALVTGHRMQTFAVIKTENIEFHTDRMEIKIPERIKTSGNGRKQPILILPNYDADNKICIAASLKCYLRTTSNIRKNVSNLFISFKRPFKAVTSQTLAHWVKDTLKESGINTDIFTAHSTRHASTSAAKRGGVDIDLLRSTAGWTTNSLTFARFYDLQISKNKRNYANAVLK